MTLQDYFLFSKLLKFKVFQNFINWFSLKYFNKPNSTTNIDFFTKKIAQLNNTFKKSKILWLEISCGKDYELSRPGVLELKNLFNKKLIEIYGENLVKSEKILMEKKYIIVTTYI